MWKVATDGFPISSATFRTSISNGIASARWMMSAHSTAWRMSFLSLTANEKQFLSIIGWKIGK